MRLRVQGFDQLGAGRRRQQIAENRLVPHRRERRHDDQLVQIFDGIGQRRLFAAPPRRHGRQRQRLTQQPFADRRQKAVQRARFHHAAAERVGDQHVAQARRLHQPRHAKRGIGAQFERIAKIVVEPAPDGVHAAQPAYGFEIHHIAAHHQIRAFDQRKAQRVRQECMFGIGFVIGSGREQHDQRRFTVVGAGRQLGQAVAQGREIGQQRLHTHVGHRVRQGARHDLAILQGVAGAGRALRTVGHGPPAAVGRARQIDRIQMQMHAAQRLDAAAGPQIAMLPENQRRRQQPLGQQRLRTVDVGQNGVEQRGALGHGRAQRLPLLGGDDLGQQIQLPRPRGALRIGIDVIGDAVGRDRIAHFARAAAQHFGRQMLQLIDQRAPVRTQLAFGREHLVVTVDFDRIVFQQTRMHKVTFKRAAICRPVQLNLYLLPFFTTDRLKVAQV